MALIQIKNDPIKVITFKINVLLTNNLNPL